MKINFGIYKNRKIVIPDNKRMRPTTSMVKSIIFNTIAIDDTMVVLDLFAGTGSLGLETLSLGAKKVYFIDNNKASVDAIKQTLKVLDVLPERFEIICTDFRRVLSSKLNYDLILLDPPFSIEMYFKAALKQIHKNNLLNLNGMIMLEKPFKMKIEEINLFKIQKQKRKGDKEILFLIKKEDEEANNNETDNQKTL